MNFNSVNSLSKTTNLLGLIGERQKLIGSNLANMDTPGYQRKDINFSQILSNSGGSLETKLAQKFDGSVVMTETTNQMINPAEELVQMQNNSLMYTVAVRRMSNIITQMKTVINVGK